MIDRHKYRKREAIRKWLANQCIHIGLHQYLIPWEKCNAVARRIYPLMCKEWKRWGDLCQPIELLIASGFYFVLSKYTFENGAVFDVSDMD